MHITLVCFAVVALLSVKMHHLKFKKCMSYCFSDRIFHFEIYIKMSRRYVSQADMEWVNYAALNSSAPELKVFLSWLFEVFL